MRLNVYRNDQLQYFDQSIDAWPTSNSSDDSGIFGGSLVPPIWREIPEALYLHRVGSSRDCVNFPGFWIIISNASMWVVRLDL